MALSKTLVKPDLSNVMKVHSVEVDTPSRLHFTLIDLHGSLDRIDGGIGIALKAPRIKIRVEPVGGQGTEDSNPTRVEPILTRIRDQLGYKGRFNIKLMDSIPKHIGLGSNTQLALAVAKAVTFFMGLDLSSHQLAQIAKRGGTSGIGVATFEHGGFVMDAGHPHNLKSDFLPSHFSNAAPPKLMMQRQIPKNWYFVITTPFIGEGLHGEREADVFKKYCPIPNNEVEKLSHIILMKLLPAVAEEDIVSFGEALRQIQSLGFKRIENDLQDEVVKDLYSFYYENDVLGAGLSSFSPTTYALVKGETLAKKLKVEIEKYLRDLGIAGEVNYSNVDNEGAKIDVHQ